MFSDEITLVWMSARVCYCLICGSPKICYNILELGPLKKDDRHVYKYRVNKKVAWYKGLSFVVTKMP